MEGKADRSETVKLRKDDPEAIKLLALQREREANGQNGGAGESTSDGASSSSASPAPVGKPKRGRKRPRQSLEALAAAIDGGKKMTTLEKVSGEVSNHE